MKLFLLLILCFSALLVHAQNIATFTVTPQNVSSISPVAVSLAGINYNSDAEQIALFEISGKNETEISCQVEPGLTPVLWFLYDSKGGLKKYEIRKVQPAAKQKGRLALENSEQGTTLKINNLPVIRYNHAEVYPPEGVDGKFKRSAFIHPLWSPGGEVLTRVQAPDHYHHYGIWNPWTKTTVEGREIDFWNLLKGQGTVKFAGYIDAVAGQVFAGFKAHQEHVFWVEQGREKLAINELWDVRVWDSGIPGISVVDLTTTLNTPLPDGIMLDAYRYGGGIGYRATEKWHKDNCSILTSEGKTRVDADGTNARWCIVEGESAVKENRSGILFLSHPANRMHPEPMRVWPLDANSGRGDMFFEFCPIRHNDWKLQPNQNYTLKYRMIVFDGKLLPQEAEKYWQSFASAPVISFSNP